nr:lytic transglycosylase domain-containing protein [Caulobacteraceae bacterium]
MRKRPRRTSIAAAIILAATGLAAARGLGSDAPAAVTTPRTAPDPYLSQSDAQAVTAVLAAAKVGDGVRIRAAAAGLQDPVARKIAQWALADSAPDSMSFLEADNARRDLAGWPRSVRRQMAAETLLDQAGMGPRQVIAWFGGEAPRTGRGALALATALGATGGTSAAADLIRKAWRTLIFDQDTQAAILARFGVVLGQADHVAREDLLLYGAQGPAGQDLLRFLPPEQQALAQARMAVRRGDLSAPKLILALPADLRTGPDLAYERIISLRDHGDTAAAVSLVGRLPASFPQQAAAERLWKHGSLVAAALEAGNYAGAYAAAAHSGLASGADGADAAFQAGWIALVRLKDARSADEHFARLQTLGRSPLTQSRALYWRGRAAQALGDPIAAQSFYAEAAKYYTTFYGQLAAAKAGAAVITLGRDPPITPADAARFESREPVRAARLLAGIGARDTFKAFVGALSETLPSAQEEALLVDFTRGWGDQEAAMRVVRNAARRGFILPERGYPIRTAPAAFGAPEAPFVLGITRQESSFDPRARSGAGARGMMQLMPATAQGVARRLGLPYQADELDDPDYNMRLGSAFLGDLVNEFSGSYLMAAAAYNAGPGRPVQWSTTCGDPRSSSTDPVDFIECIPFSETRDYVMRVLEATQVYRARLAGGSAPITL